jgi:hypothetical protein
VEIGPLRGNQRARAIGQHQQQVQTVASTGLAGYRERLAYERMPGASDDDACRKVIVMGSVWTFRSTTSITTS